MNKNIYGAIGYTILKHPTTEKLIIIFADRHDNLNTCDNNISIAEWIKLNMDDSIVLLEEVPRTGVKLSELWASSVHTQDLKNLFLKYPKDILGFDIRHAVMPFSWETIIVDKDEYKNIILYDYLRNIDNVFCLKNPYLIQHFTNYHIDNLKYTKTGEHYLLIKDYYKKFLQKYKSYLKLPITTIKSTHEEIFHKMNLILDKIMEWYGCGLCELYNNMPIILHAGLAHSEYIVEILQSHYKYEFVIDYGINNMERIDPFKLSHGCVSIAAKYETKF
jgi:hypothetical protein